MLVCCQEGDDSQGVDKAHHPLAGSIELLPQVRVFNNCGGRFQSGDIEGLTGGDQGDRVLGDGRVQRGDRQVGMAGKDQIAVDFVGADRHPMAQADVCHAFQFLAGEDTPGGVLRVAEHKDARFGGDGSLEGVQVYLVLPIRALGELRFVLDQVEIFCHPKEGAISWGLNQHAISRLGDGIR